jgi:hypothetical protein
MAEDEADYLRQCVEQNNCPVCQQPIAKKLGTGRIQDGLFCSLDCYGKWNEKSLVRRHIERVKKGTTGE